MEPVSMGAFIAAANASVKLGQMAGLVRDEARELARETNAKVGALLEQDFNVALSMVDASAHALDEVRQTELLVKARDKFENAEATSELSEHFRGFAAAMCAALAIRLRGDGGEARMWLGRAVDHYDAALRQVHKRAQTAVKARKVAPKFGKRASAVARGITPLVALGAGQAVRRRAQLKSARVPGRDVIAAINLQTQDAHRLAGEVGADLAGRAVAVSVKRSKDERYVTGSDLRVVT